MFTKIKELFLGKPSIAKDSSSKMEVNATDWKKVVINTLIVGAAAAITFLGQQISQVDFGQFGTFVVPLISGALVFLQKWLKDNEAK
jgi:hypothetical protein